MKELSILGRTITLQQRTKAQLKGINMGESLTFSFYDGEFYGMNLLFLEPKKNNPTPRECSITAERMQSLFGLSVVFILSSGPSYERQRLMDKNVYFVMGEKFAFLPTLVANERMRKTRPAKRLSLVAQYTLLYHLQVESLEGLSAREMAEKLPYSYESITLGLTCLEDLKLCKKVPDGPKTKIVHFLSKGRELWDKAQPYMVDPVEKRVYCDSLNSDVQYTNCNINALSHYSWLNPDANRMIMMSKKQLQQLIDDQALINANEFDGEIMIEAWKYPVVSSIGSNSEWVDKLSLVISLREDPDARVEGEVERVINELEWKD